MNFTTSEMKLLEKKLGCYFKLIEFTTVNSTESLLNSRDVNVDLIYTFSLLIILNIAANSLLILGIIKTNKKLNSGQKLFIYLSCTDLVAGLVAMPLMMNYLIYGATCFYMTFMMAARAYVVYGDSCIFLVISVQRYYTLRDPIGSKLHQKKRLSILIGLQMTMSILMSVAFFGFYHYSEDLHDFKIIGYIANVVHSSLSITILTFIGMSLYSIRKYSRSNNDTFTQKQLRNHRKSVSSLLVIGIMMLVHMLIYSTILAYWHSKSKDQNVIFGNNYHDIKNITDMVMLISFVNTTTNSFVIIGRSQKIMRYFFGCCI